MTVLVRLLRLLLLLLISGLAWPATAERKIFDDGAPYSLRAVGQLTVPGKEFSEGRWRMRDEHCSATLVSESLILTAWHCLDYYEDLSRSPVFVLSQSDALEPVAARQIASGGSMRADWALLRLARPIRSVTPLSLAEASDADTDLTLAGYARDKDLGEFGENLTYQTGCHRLEPLDGQWSTDCVTFRGASGGPVLASGRVVGVISRGDSTQRTYFAPSAQFFSAYRALALPARKVP